MNEIWKDIEGYEGLYQISSLGKVKSLNYHRTGKEKILKSCKNRGGYLKVNLCKEGKVKYYLIHRLVAQAFLDNPNNYPIINHRDENPKNNSVENLEFCTAEYNSNYGTRIERFIQSKSIPILQFTKEGEFVRKWESAKEVQQELGIDRGSLSRCCKGKRYKSTGGYVWGYADNYERIPFKVFDLEMYEKKKAA